MRLYNTGFFHKKTKKSYALLGITCWLIPAYWVRKASDCLPDMNLVEIKTRLEVYLYENS